MSFNAFCYCTDCNYACIFSAIVPSEVLLSGILLNIVILDVGMLSEIKLMMLYLVLLC